LEHSGAKVVLVDYEFAHLVPKNLPSHVTVIQSNDTGGTKGIDADPYERFLQDGRDIWDRLELEEKNKWGEKARKGYEMLEIIDDEEKPCALCYTSGTTGKPKGVLTTHRSSYLAAISNAFESQLDNHSVYLWVLPAFHAVGWTYPWAITAALGTNYVLRRVDVPLIWDALLNQGITHYCGAPTVQISLVNHELAKKVPRRIKVAIAASAPTADLLGKLEQLNIEPVHVVSNDLVPTSKFEY
jgi:acyl-CoA synthetase (AMP-forming)/AMP-acid ligase II